MAAAALLLLGGTVFNDSRPNPAEIAGRWSVDLRLEQADRPYHQLMQLTVAEDGAVTGEFGNSPILAGRTGSGQGRDCVAFRTADSGGANFSSACIVAGRMVGQTWSEARNFVLPWTAERR